MKMTIGTLLTAVIFVMMGCDSVIQKKTIEPQPTGQRAMTFEGTVTTDFEYLLFLPENYNEKDEWPMILFLHGAGERGNDIHKVEVHGPPKIVKNRPDFPFIVVSPQCAQNSRWTNELETLKKLVDKIQSEYNVDKNHTYLTGLSMGGFGSWALANEYPDVFAAMIPICGGGDTNKVDGLKNIPIWAFHGAKDPTVPLNRSEVMVDAVNNAGGSAKLTVYPELQHDSWTVTYENEEIYTWLLSHTLDK